MLSVLDLRGELSRVARILALAYELALRGDSNCFYGAVLTDTNGLVISAGYNHRYDVGGDDRSKRKIVHAEVHALLQNQAQLRGAGGVMYVVQVEPAGAHFMNATPCVMCTSALSKFGVKLCCFTKTEGRSGRLKISHNPSVDTGSLDIAKRSNSYVRLDLPTLVKRFSLSSAI